RTAAPGDGRRVDRRRGGAAPDHAARRRGRGLRRPAGSPGFRAADAAAERRRERPRALRSRGGRAGRLAHGLPEPVLPRSHGRRLDRAGAAMRRRAVVAVAVAAALLGAPTRARAEACSAPRDAAGGPLPGGTDGADYGAIPDACGATDLGLRLRASALV